MKIKIFAIIPVSVIFISAFVSQYISLSYIQVYSESLQDQLFQSQINFSRSFTQILSQQINNEVQKCSEYIYLLNNYFSKLINGRILFQDPHIYTFLEENKLNQGTEDPVLLSLYYQRPLLTNLWYHKNATKISELNSQASNLIRNASRFYVLQRALEYENRYFNQNNNRKLTFYNIIMGYQLEGMLTSSPINTTNVNVTNPVGCKYGILPYDPRCRFWFEGSILSASQVFFKPNILLSSVATQIGTSVCQQLQLYNITSQSPNPFSAICINMPLFQLQNFFTHFSKSTVQSYLIDPRSLTIVYNSNLYQDEYNLTITTLNEVELQYLQSQQDAQLLNSTINQYYTTWINGISSQIQLRNSAIIQSKQIQIPYNRNGTSCTVLLTPVVIYEKIPFYEGYDQWTDLSKGRYYTEIPYLLISIISDQDLKAQADQIGSFFHNFFVIVYTLLGVSSVISIIIINFYSNQISLMISNSLNTLISILTKLNGDDTARNDIFMVNSEEVLYSFETIELYESFKGIYSLLLYTSENFFSDNQANTLLRLNRNIAFFKQFGNIEAVGITLNNIGSIFLSESHYFQALESFSESIIYAKYQIQQFCAQYPNSISSHLLSDYSFDNQLDQIKIYNKNSSLIKLNSNKENYFSKFRNFLQKKGTSTLISPQTIEKINVDSVDQLFISKQNKIQNEEFYEDRMLLLSCLYYRKYNFINALISFQESNDRRENTHLQKQQKKNDYHVQQKEVFSNFWTEIKKLLKELLILAKQLPFENSQDLIILAKISLCNHRLSKKQKADQIIQQCEEDLNQQIPTQVTVQHQEENELTHKTHLNIPINLQQKDAIQKKYVKQKNQQMREEQKDSLKPQQIEGESIFEASKLMNANLSTLKKHINSNFSSKPSLSQSKIEKGNHQFLEFNSLGAKIKNQNNLEINKIAAQASTTIKTLNVNQKQQLFSKNDRTIRNTQKGRLQSKKNTYLLNQSVNEYLNSFSDKNENSNNFDFSSNLKEVFNFKKNMENLLNQDEIFSKIFSYDTKDTYICFLKAEYLTSEKKYIQAALELTTLLEKKMQFASYSQYRIYHQLKIIFNKLNTPCKELDILTRKFNSNLSLHVEVIIQNSLNENWILKVVQFIYNLIKNTLDGSNDQIGVTIADQYENFIFTYMETVKVTQIKYDLKAILNKILHLTLKKKIFTSFSDHHINNHSNISQEGLIENTVRKEQYQKEKINIISQQESESISLKCPEIISFNNTEYLQYLNNNQEMDDMIDPQTQKDNTILINLAGIGGDLEKETELIKNRSTKYEQLFQQYSFGELSSFVSQDILKENLNNSLLGRNKQFDKRPQIFQHKLLTQNIGDQNCFADAFISETELLKSETTLLAVNNSSNNNNNEQKEERSEISQSNNSMLHFSLRKVLNKLSAQSYFQELPNNELKKNYEKRKQQQQDAQFETTFSSINNNSKMISFDLKKIIIFSTEKLYIQKNYLFEQLCEYLFNSDIMLLILTFEKGNNFLVNYQDQTQVYHDKEIIKVFDSIQNIQYYLSSQRDKLCTVNFPTFIQHF